MSKSNNLAGCDRTKPPDRPIGVFDSGLGGLTVVRELTRALPAEDIVYLGDSARVPYGIKSPETIRRFASEAASFLLRFDPKMLVVACNTASAVAVEMLESSCPVPVVDVIRPGAAAGLAATDGAVGVIATEATIASGAYQRLIADAGRESLTAACPLLVPIVEEGRDESDPIVLAVLGDYLHELQRRRPGVLILGCTHYPLLAGAIAKLMGPHVLLVSSAAAAAVEVHKRLLEADLGNPRTSAGSLRCFTTDNPDRFERLGERFLGRDGGPDARRIDRVEHVGTDELETKK